MAPSRSSLKISLSMIIIGQWSSWVPDKFFFGNFFSPFVILLTFPRWNENQISFCTGAIYRRKDWSKFCFSFFRQQKQTTTMQTDNILSWGFFFLEFFRIYLMAILIFPWEESFYYFLFFSWCWHCQRENNTSKKKCEKKNKRERF